MARKKSGASKGRAKKVTKKKGLKFRFPALFRIVPLRPKKQPPGKKAKLLTASNTCCPEGCSHVCFIDTDHGRLEVCACSGGTIIVQCPVGSET